MLCCSRLRHLCAFLTCVCVVVLCNLCATLLPSKLLFHLPKMEVGCFLVCPAALLQQNRRAACVHFVFFFKFSSPVLGMSSYEQADYFDGTKVMVCHTTASTFWPTLYFLTSIFIFFLLPLILLLILYFIIAKHLIANPSALHSDSYSARARRQVLLMLGTVVLSFFICLIPFRALTLWIIIAPEESVNKLGAERYYVILYICRIMVYLNSMANPILYNLMSSKFRDGFLICSRNRKRFRFRRVRNGTLSTTCRSSTCRDESYRICYRARTSSVLLRHSPESRRSNDSPVAGHNNEEAANRHFSVVSESVVIYPEIHDCKDVAELI